ncbi:MAG TPA: S1 RNA-binding domain-containing protein [bacterium]|nr:S1 RNA-binding domain-containing protein [bacterium]
MNNEVGDLVEGTVVDIAKFGAFVKIKGGKTGLVHISQISDKFVREISEFVAIGMPVVAKVISVDDKGRVQLSIKNVTQEEKESFDSGKTEAVEKEVGAEEASDKQRQSGNRSENQEEDSFEKKLKNFMRQSEDRLVDVKRSIESKRGSRKRKK